MTDGENSHIVTKRKKNYYKGKRIKAQRTTRDTTLSIRLKTKSFSNIDMLLVPPTDISALKQVFFNDKTLLTYDREHWLRKLILCQYVMQSEQTETMQSIPFVLRLNHKDMELDLKAFKRKIRDTFKKALGEVPLYWLNFEYNTKGIRNKHCNGEILINPELLPVLKNALERLYGLNTNGVKHAVRFPVGSRQKQAKRHGSFYAVYNWAGYGTKESHKAHFERDFIKKEGYSKGDYHSISSELNSKAKTLHQEITLKNKSPAT